MSYLNCPRCGLSIRLRAPYLALERCPRCLARAGLTIPMYVTRQPRGIHRAAPEPRPRS